MIYRETTCKTALSRSTLPGLVYSLNPYTGCEHGCIYCYAPATLRYAGAEPWGTFVTAKTNIPVVLERELRRVKPGTVGISTVTDPYQPLEKRLRLTRSCLEVLLAKSFPVCVQTKSALVLRDLDLLGEFKDAEVGFTITTLSDEVSAALEPGASLPGERLRALRALSSAGIEAWAFVGPMIPGLMDRESLHRIFEEAKAAGVSRVLVDRLRLRPGLQQKIEPVVLMHLHGSRGLPGGGDACPDLVADAMDICKDIGLACEPAF
jgi:DNA repair photolyase